MSKWVKASELGLFAGLKPALGLPAWAIEPERYAVTFKIPPRVDQHLFDAEIKSIILNGKPTDLDLLRAMKKGSYVPIRQREAFRRELYAANPNCFWCHKVMDIENRTIITATGREKHNDSYASFEHLKPRWMGGRFTRANICLAHAGCNRKRHQKHHLPRYEHDPYRGVSDRP
jgi:hypothetical protein